MTHMKARAQVVVFGSISAYNAPAGHGGGYGRMDEILRRRLQVSGFLLSDHVAHFPAALAQLRTLYRESRIHLREHVTDGLERAPEAFAALFTAAAPGKHLVQISADAP